MAKYSFGFKKESCSVIFKRRRWVHSIFLKRMESLLKEILSNGFTIIKLWEMKVYCVLEKMIYYSFEKKLSVVELYLSSEISYQESGFARRHY